MSSCLGPTSGIRSLGPVLAVEKRHPYEDDRGTERTESFQKPDGVRDDLGRRPRREGKGDHALLEINQHEGHCTRVDDQLIHVV
jgi:hypothetical protein